MLPDLGCSFFGKTQIQIFEIHNLSIFFGKEFEKMYFWQAVFWTKKHDILTEPMYVGSALTLSHKLHIIPC